MDKLSSGDPRTIGAYRLLGRLGAGGMGQVYLARSERGRTVALKVVHSELAGREEFRERFRQEVAAARRVGGAWTAPVLDADTEAEVPWVATGYVAGPSLHSVVARGYGPLPERSVHALAAGLVRALTDIHAAGLVHRDLKPSNVLLTIDGPRVIDFGIARALETATAGGLTHTGALIGSPGFMAPEQIRGDRVTPACDVFCLGSLLAYAGTGKLPFGADNSGVHVQLFRIAQEPPDLTGLPESLQDLVTACLAKKPSARPSLTDLLALTGGTDTTLPDGRTREPWLPSALVAQLGRHAAELLEAEHPEPEDEQPQAGQPEEPGQHPPKQPPEQQPEQQPQSSPEAATASVPPPSTATAPTLVAPPPPSSPPPGHEVPHTLRYEPAPPPPPRRGGRMTAALLAVAVVVALGAGGTVYAVIKGDEGRQPTAAPSETTTPTNDAEPGKSDARPSPDELATPTDSLSPITPPSPSPDAGDVPKKFLGVWRATFQAQGGTNTRVLTLRQGNRGETMMSLVGNGPTYACRWKASLQSGAGSQLSLNPSQVTQGPTHSCKPGPVSLLRLQPDGTLVRTLVGSGGTPLTYRKQTP
ncbi:serine/threonine-protein kinase [Streptomyces sp. O3]